VSLLHAGSLVCALVLLRAAWPPAPIATAAVERLAAPLPPPVALGAYTAAAYLLLVGWLRRSPRELRAALLAQLAGGAALAWGRLDADGLTLLLLVGWTGLLATRATVKARAAAVALLTAACCLYDTSAVAAWPARGHMLAMTARLFAVGWRWPQTGYRGLAVCAAAAWAAVLATRAGLSGQNPLAAGAVLAAFGLLAAGAAISWHKHRWLAPAAPAEAAPADRGAATPDAGSGNA
jgi:hypothetical protein